MGSSAPSSVFILYIHASAMVQTILVFFNLLVFHPCSSAFWDPHPVEGVQGGAPMRDSVQLVRANNSNFAMIFMGEVYNYRCLQVIYLYVYVGDIFIVLMGLS